MSRGADLALTAHVVDLSARNRADAAESRARNARVAAIQKELAAKNTRAGIAAPGASGNAAAGGRDDSGNEPEPLGYAELVGKHGGLTAVLLAAREGFAETVFALLDGGADINQVSGGDRTSPLLMATINGHFDLALGLLERGAKVTIASDAGATPLYGVLNMQWAPKARHPQPAEYMQQHVDYLALCEALLKAGADPNARLTKSLWYTTYNRDLLGVDRTGATPFWLAAYTLDLPAMKLLLKYGADPNIPTAKVPERYEDVDIDGPDLSGLPPMPWGGPAVLPIHAASGVGYGLGYAGNTHRHVPDGWLPAVKFLVEELGASVNARDHNGYSPLHHAAARGDNELIRYLVAKGADVTAVSRFGQTTVDMANGPVQRIQPFPDTVALLEKLGAKNSHKCVSC
jgi:ankyrin repeat protein